MADWIRVQEGHAEGDLVCAAGHRIPLPNGGTDGIYAGWCWAEGKLIVEQDRYGLYPLFEWVGDRTRVLSTDVQRLLALGAPADLDLDALAVFVRVGFFVGADTPFRAIRAVLPPPLPRTRLEITRRAAVDGFLDLFAAAIRRRLPSGPYVLPLSGGRDSRHILFELCDHGYPPAACVTVRHFPPRPNLDASIAGQLCAALRLQHTVLEQPRDRVAIEHRKNLSTHFCTDEHAQFVVLASHLRTHTRETYDGIGGDVLSQSAYLRGDGHELLARGDVEKAATFVLDRYDSMMQEEALERLLAPAAFAALSRERAIARLQRELAQHVDAPNPLASFFFANRTRREIALAPYGLMSDLTVFAPYLDGDLYDFLASLPADLVMDRSLHTEAIARRWPQFEQVPYEQHTTRTADPAAARALAAYFARRIARDAMRGRVRRSTLLPGLLATCLDGAEARLWCAPLLFYLDTLADVSSPCRA